MMIAFRVDGSLQIGTGHVMRCLTLADALRNRGMQCNFLCRPHQGHLLELINQRGHHVLALRQSDNCSELGFNDTAHAHWLGVNWETDAKDTLNALSEHFGNQIIDWLVVDHYSLDARWEQALRPKSRRIMVIDDLADRPHDCDLLLDQNLGRKTQDYDELLKGSAVKLIGPSYALLRPEFASMRQQSLTRRRKNPQLHRLLITMGGVDKNNATEQVLAVLQNCVLPADFKITVVMGLNAPWLSQVQAQAVKIPCKVEVLVGVNNFSQIMADSDLAITAAGGTVWELCSLGVPSFLLVLSRNQISGCIALQNAGAAIALESIQQLESLWNDTLAKDSPNKILLNLSSAASAITDGDGCKRATHYIMKNGNV
jgi:UDP-2,4-diacetamido-2,4,6-trideoxy-beta-L-altropyranose hydrolase